MSTKKKSSSEGYAIASLVIGSLALLMFWLPYIGFVFGILSLVLALAGIFIRLQNKQKSILVFIALGLSIIVSIMSGRVTLKTNEIISNFQNDTKLIFKNHNNINTQISTDSNNIHILINDNQNTDSVNIEFKNLEKIMDNFNDSSGTNIQIKIK